jgi:hypothetical protein
VRFGDRKSVRQLATKRARAKKAAQAEQIQQEEEEAAEAAAKLKAEEEEADGSEDDVFKVQTGGRLEWRWERQRGQRLDRERRMARGTKPPVRYGPGFSAAFGESLSGGGPVPLPCLRFRI